MGIAVRQATRADMPLITSLVRALAEYEGLSHAVRMEDDKLEAYLFGERPMAEVLIGECDGGPRGFALFFHNFSTFEGRPGIWLEDLFVMPEWRRSGLGRALLTEVARIALQRDCGRLVVLTVGSYRRNFSLLREICARVGDDEAIVFEIIGPVERRDDFLGMPNVTYRSAVSDMELASAYERASCFLMTAENTTANNALLEAMAFGLPVVGERVGGVPEYTSEECARLTEANDAAGIAEQLRRLACSPAMRSELGAASRARAELLDWRRVAQLTSEIYRAVQ